MKTRFIKPGFWLNEELAQLSERAQLTYIGLWMLADRGGYLEDRPAKIAAQLCPYKRIDIEKVLNELAENKLIHRYVSNSVAVIYIPTFLEHQNVHPNEKSYNLPEYLAEPEKLIDVATCRVLPCNDTAKNEINSRANIYISNSNSNSKGGTPDKKAPEYIPNKRLSISEDEPQRVKLTLSDIEKLKKEIGNNIRYYVHALHDHLGKKKTDPYKSHLSTVRSWHRRDAAEGKGPYSPNAQREQSRPHVRGTSKAYKTRAEAEAAIRDGKISYGG